MKSAYITPQSTAFSLETEQIIAASNNLNIDVNHQDDLDAAETFSNKRYPWDNEIWDE